MRNLILFGAGNEARRLLKTTMKYFVAYLVDNNKCEKEVYVDGIEVISYEIFKEFYSEQNYILVLAIKNKKQEVISQLKRDNISYLESTEYFKKIQFCSLQDESLLEKYLYDNTVLEMCYYRKLENWYREEFYNDRNKELIEMMKSGNKEGVNVFLSKIYSDSKEYEDEKYENRPGMRLIKNILLKETTPIKICDFACGHGALIKELKWEGYQVYGIDSSEKRTKTLECKKIDVQKGDICNVPFDDNMFDVAICLECLEHVENPIIVLNEIIRTLKVGGRIYCTVPLGKYNDYETHVRHFDEVSLYSLFYQVGFKVRKMLRIPYVNESPFNNLFIEGEKNYGI